MIRSSSLPVISRTPLSRITNPSPAYFQINSPALPSASSVLSAPISSSSLSFRSRSSSVAPQTVPRLITQASPLPTIRRQITQLTAPASAGSAYIAGTNRAPILAPEQHRLNVDPAPILIRKKPIERVQYTQNVSLKFLKPPPAPKPGDITIQQEPDVQIPPAPALLIRQKPALPVKPPPAIFREQPPKPPVQLPPKFITIPGKVLPPPPRQVIVERLPQLPPKPRDIIIERWLAYDRRTRNVVFKPAPPLIPLPAPKNVLIQWDSPDVVVSRQNTYLGVNIADPAYYTSVFGANLTDPYQLPAEVNQFQPPVGERLAVNSNPNEVPRLVGDVDALGLVDLDSVGLSEYKPQLMEIMQRFGLLRF